MKILWIYPEFPYPLTSGFLRGFHLLRLLGRDHTITFLTLSSETSVSQERIQALQPYTERIEIFSKCPHPKRSGFMLSNYIPVLGRRIRDSRNTQNAVTQLKMRVRHLLRQEHFDVMLFHGRESLPVLDNVGIPLVADCGDTNCTRILQQMHHVSLLSRPRLFYHYLKERQLEQRLARKTPYRCFISARDRDNLLGPADSSAIVPQGVDDEYWRRGATAREEKHCIAFSGVMSYPPNIDAATFLLDKVIPLVRHDIPVVQVLIVGRDPSPEVIQAASRHDDVVVTGAVPDVRPYLERADVFVAALRFASGVQNKVLEAMAMEVPVVTTPVVAAGLRVDGADPPLVIGGTAVEIAAGIVRLLRDPEERTRLAVAGRRFIEAQCSWPRSAERLEKICLAAVSEFRFNNRSSSTVRLWAGPE